MRKKIFHVLRVAATIGLLWFLVSRIDIGEAVNAVKKSNFLFAVPAIASACAAWFLNSVRWKNLLRIVGLKAPILKIFLYNLIGIFYSIVLPGGKLAGDTVSAYRFMKDTGDGRLNEGHLISAFIDRFIGFLSFLFLSSLFFVLNYPPIEVFGIQKVLLGALLTTLSIGGLFLAFSGSLDFFIPRKIYSAFAAYRYSKKSVFFALVLSFLSAFFNVLSVYFLSLAVGINQSFLGVGFAYLFATVLVILPVTVAGVGLREGGLIYVLTRLGTSLPNAAALSVLMLALFASFALAGGIAELILALRRDDKIKQ